MKKTKRFHARGVRRVLCSASRLCGGYLVCEKETLMFGTTGAAWLGAITECAELDGRDKAELVFVTPRLAGNARP